MSDKMYPIPFGEMINWILSEYKKEKSIFGVHKLYKKNDQQTLSIFGEMLETPFGPAAGPHNQLAQNIIAAYVGGARFFELKTVQPVDGEDLAALVSKPCITAGDECYNCEWSTELRVEEAYDEYVKAWFAIKLLAKEMGFGSPDGFIFNMSVGYDFAGVQTEKIDHYIEGMKNAENSAVWQECMDYTLAHLDQFDNIDAGYVRNITPVVSRSITLSTLHGCPPDEIERIASYLINEKGLNTFVKCNPTMLGYESAREILDSMGYDYMDFDDYHFLHDLQFKDAVPMFTRLKKEAADKGVAFGVKITNTFPQKVIDGVLPSEDMYMSGRSLFPCSIELANRLEKAFDGDLRISYSGGADIFNIKDIFKAGVWPITLATTLLKPGGYNRLDQMAEDLVSYNFKEVQNLKPSALSMLAKRARTNPHNVKGAIKPLPSRKFDKKVPLVDCFTAPCSEACPISQDIPDYIELLGENRPLEALKVITAKNPLPFITGTICNHRCMDNCTRNFYEAPLCIRDVKLNAAELGYDDLLKEIKPIEKRTDAKVAIIGGGPAGISAAYFLARNGISATIFERNESLGGIVRHVVPEFRVDAEIVENDVNLMEAYGVEVVTNKEISSVEELKSKGFKYVIAATGAWGPSPYKLEGEQAINVLDFLQSFRKDASSLKLGKDVVVIGGGNTAMDAARAAKKAPGVENVHLVYRRTKRYMPADEEELAMALEDGVKFYELLSPEKFDGSLLSCRKMVLGAPDSSGRRSPENTDEFMDIPANTVIASVGAKIDKEWFAQNKIALTDRDRVEVNKDTLEARDNIFVAGDAQLGAATVVQAIADARKVTDTIVKAEALEPASTYSKNTGNYERALAKRGILAEPKCESTECSRCLECSTVCESCMDVCPNRANLALFVPHHKMRQIVHVDRMCNECGNCQTFCPYDSAPYKDKFTLYHTLSDFEDSSNSGFLVTGDHCVKVRLEGNVIDASIGDNTLPQGINDIIKAVVNNYSYLL